ncbi:MAG: hypothetical protein K2H53_02735 [Clostridia bacterium]|nr:hypothetical protein [Clostridia bacterium]
MNRQKLATIGCIILSIVFSVLLGLFIHFKAFLPTVLEVYEKSLYYPEALYEEYQKEAEGMIDRHEYTCKYPAKTTFYSEDGRTTLVIEIGEYDKGFSYSNYITATIKNFGTNEQEVTFERSRKSAEEAYEGAENYRNGMRILTAIFVLILVAFTVYLIKNSIKRRYSKVFTPMLFIVALIVVTILMLHFLLA